MIDMFILIEIDLLYKLNLILDLSTFIHEAKDLSNVEVK